MRASFMLLAVVLFTGCPDEDTTPTSGPASCVAYRDASCRRAVDCAVLSGQLKAADRDKGRQSCEAGFNKQVDCQDATGRGPRYQDCLDALDADTCTPGTPNVCQGAVTFGPGEP